jgi:hypothetical protein
VRENKRHGLGVYVYYQGDTYFGQWGNNQLLKGITYLYQRYSFTYIQAPMSSRMVSLTKDKFIMAKPDLVSIDMPTATSIKDSGTRISSKVMASCIILIKIRTKANGSKAKRMDTALTITTMVLSIKVILLMVEKTEWAQ